MQTFYEYEAEFIGRLVDQSPLIDKIDIKDNFNIDINGNKVKLSFNGYNFEFEVEADMDHQNIAYKAIESFRADEEQFKQFKEVVNDAFKGRAKDEIYEFAMLYSGDIKEDDHGGEDALYVLLDVIYDFCLDLQYRALDYKLSLDPRFETKEEKENNNEQ